MRLIRPYFEIIGQKLGEVGMLKHIETCGRVAWKSEERTTEDSYVKFVDMLKGVNHGSVLEHGTVYLLLYIEDTTGRQTSEHSEAMKYTLNKYSKCIWSDNRAYVITNYRVLIENNWLDDLKYQCEPTKFHEKRVSVKFICDRGVSHEFVRHRTFSFTQESTRYCNYTKDKFSNEITFIKPCWDFNGNEEMYYVNALETCETEYFQLISKGWKPQQARSVLPNSLKTELIMTGFISDWKHFFHLRTAIGAHPQARELAIPLHKEFIKLNLI